MLLPARPLLTVILLAMLIGCDGRPKQPARPAPAPPPSNMVLLPGGTFLMGTDTGQPHEGPRHAVKLRQFYIDKTDVTVAEFGRFVAATGYVTDAEKYGWSGVFDLTAARWEKRDGVTWRHPDRPGLVPPPDEPVVQVSWNDATAYAKWAGKRLPTEAEFEYAARGGLVGKQYAWGDDLRPGGHPVANFWQGHFPDLNTAEDGYLMRSPVGHFPPNGFGLSDMAGNVWQWCSDWYGPGYSPSPADDPPGPPTGNEHVIRGGSFLCAENFCCNYRVAGRSSSTADSATNNCGFRCARDVR